VLKPRGFYGLNAALKRRSSTARDSFGIEQVLI
jgi:hypothetical protein